MICTVRPSTAYGAVTVPPSKSMAHRLLICAGLADGESVIENLADSEDVLATEDCLAAFGAGILRQQGSAVIRGTDPRRVDHPLTLPCRECGSTLRFLIPLALLTGQPALFTGSPALLSRPLSVYETLCARQGSTFRREGTSLEVSGRLKPAVYEVPGDISSQFVSGLLFALPLLSDSSEIRLLPPVESRPYIEMTLAALRDFGIRVVRIGNDRLHVPGNQSYRPRRAAVEGDWSNAAFLEALNLLGGKVTPKGLSAYSRQGDRIYREHFKTLNAGFGKIDLSDCPDLGPILFALAAEKHGALFTGVRRLRLKESDRCAVMARELRKLGAEVITEEDHVWISREALHAPEEPLDSHNDHRVAMALTVLLTVHGGQLLGAEAARKSYPDFYLTLQKLGVELTLTQEPIETEVQEDGVDH